MVIYNVPYVKTLIDEKWVPLIYEPTLFKEFTSEEFNTRFGKSSGKKRFANVVVVYNERKSYKMANSGNYALSFVDFHVSGSLRTFVDEVVSNCSNLTNRGVFALLSLVTSNLDSKKNYVTEEFIAKKEIAEEISRAINTVLKKKVCFVVGESGAEVKEEPKEEVSKIKREKDFFYVEEDANKVLTLAHLLATKKGFANVLITGASGFGKTTLASLFAKKTGRKFIKVDMSLISEPSEIFGSLELKDGTTVFNETPFSLSIKEGNVVILLDEINRAYPNVTNPLLGLLDDTHSVTYGGIVYSVAPNTVFIVTANIGGQYTGTFKADAALLNRMNYTCSVGTIPPLEEIRIYMSKVGITNVQANSIVSALIDCRSTLADENIDFSPRTGLTIAQIMEFGGSLRFAFMSAFGSLEDEQKKSILDILSKRGEFKTEHTFTYLFD